MEVAAKLLDYGYSDEGILLYNFGIEGESFVFENGVPKYTKLIKDNPDGYDMFDVMSNYIRAHYSGPFIQMREYGDQYFELPEQQDALLKWSDNNADAHVMPFLHIENDEANIISVLLPVIINYAENGIREMQFGIRDVNEFDLFVKTLYNMGIQSVLDIYQRAYDRYIQG